MCIRDSNRMVTILDTVTGKEVRKPICDVATSHMARRNFIGKDVYKRQLVAMQLVHNIIVMYKLIGIFLHESLVDKVERVYRLQKLILCLLYTSRCV